MQFLDRQFPASQICPAHKVFEFEDLYQQNRLSGYSFYRGHFGIDLPRRVDPNGRIITFLRRPIPRLFSIWRHLRSRPIPFHGVSGILAKYSQSVAAATHRLDFDEFCHFMMEAGSPIFNSMTRQLGFGSGANLLEGEEDPSPEEMLNQAKRAIDSLAFVGFTETYDRSAAQLQHQFGWMPEPITPVNAAPSFPMPVRGTFLEWLEYVTRFDTHLYEYALYRHDNDIA